MRAASARRASTVIVAGNSACWPKRGNAGLITDGLEMLEHVPARRLVAAPPGGHRRHPQLLAEHVAAQAGQERHQGRGLHQAAAETVGDEDGAGARRLHQAGHAEQRIAAQLERVAEVVVEPAQDHVHRVEAGERLEIHAVVAHREIGAADQREVPVPGEERVLEVGFAVRARPTSPRRAGWRAGSARGRAAP